MSLREAAWPRQLASARRFGTNTCEVWRRYDYTDIILDQCMVKYLTNLIGIGKFLAFYAKCK